MLVEIEFNFLAGTQVNGNPIKIKLKLQDNTLNAGIIFIDQHSIIKIYFLKIEIELPKQHILSPVLEEVKFRRMPFR